jgi:hypothetical protein
MFRPSESSQDEINGLARSLSKIVTLTLPPQVFACFSQIHQSPPAAFAASGSLSAQSPRIPPSADSQKTAIVDSVIGSSRRPCGLLLALFVAQDCKHRQLADSCDEMALSVPQKPQRSLALF